MQGKRLTAFLNEKDKVDELGNKTRFRKVSTNLVSNVVNQGKWFSFCARISDDQIDIMAAKDSAGEKLGHIINEESGYEYTSYRSSIYKYLLREFLCYIEVPVTIRDRDYGKGYKQTFNKYLATSNIEVVARWLDLSVEEANSKYGYRLCNILEDNECDLFPYLKLYATKDGIHKVTTPRKDVDLGESGTRVIPLYALKAGVDILYKKLLEDTYDVVFSKDSGQIRTINTTFSTEKIMSVYTGSIVNNHLEGVYDGDFLANSTLERGYIRVFEMGSSIYDSPLRSINYARIISFCKAEPDLTYMNIDMDCVMETFINCVYDLKQTQIDELVESLEVYDVGTERKINKMDLATANDIEMWAESQIILLSTVFLRQLALFMLCNPNWFKGYTGAPKTQQTGNSKVDFCENIEDEFELALG